MMVPRSWRYGQFGPAREVVKERGWGYHALMASGAAPPIESIRDYHQLSKHRPEGYAPGPAGLDWANQPDPFRRFEGAPRMGLPLRADGLRTPFEALHRPDAVEPVLPGPEAVAALFELSLGLSAWKSQGGNRWALRCNPSSGNLHPVEAYLVSPDLPGLEGGLYHYLSLEHALERRAGLSDLVSWDGFLVGLSYIPWREAWKYGVRAFRYCQLDLGHAMAALRYAAAALGWRARLLTAPGDGEVGRLLGLDRERDFEGAEKEAAGLLMAVGPETAGLEREASLALPEGARWQGRASRLSAREIEWPPVTAAIRHSAKPRTAAVPAPAHPDLPPLRPWQGSVEAATLIRQRRSAQAFDGGTLMDRRAFFHLLDCLLPRPGIAPWDALPWSPRIHPMLFVHRVAGLEPGLYAFARTPRAERLLRSLMRPGFQWAGVEGCPRHLPLRFLQEGDFQDRAGRISCFQDIAADGAFSLGMLAEFRMAAEAPWWYRYLCWEAGMLGQALYLEAEAAGLRGTGIGCYFDDAMHRLLGLKGHDWQVLYHFTVGAPFEGPRLETHPPYAHLGGCPGRQGGRGTCSRVAGRAPKREAPGCGVQKPPKGHC